MIVTGILVVTFLPLATVMVWQCWNLQPMPAVRFWALSFAGLSLAMVLQSARADYWYNRFVRAEQLPRLARQLPPQLPQPWKSFEQQIAHDQRVQRKLERKARQAIQSECGISK